MTVHIARKAESCMPIHEQWRLRPRLPNHIWINTINLFVLSCAPLRPETRPSGERHSSQSHSEETNLRFDLQWNWKLFRDQDNIQIAANGDIRQRRQLKGPAAAALLLSQHHRALTSPIPFLAGASVSLHPRSDERDLRSFILNSTRGRYFDDLSFSVAYRHYLKRIKIAVVENLSASKLVLLSECIIYRFSRIRCTGCDISNYNFIDVDEPIFWHYHSCSIINPLNLIYFCRIITIESLTIFVLNTISIHT